MSRVSRNELSSLCDSSITPRPSAHDSHFACCRGNPYLEITSCLPVIRYMPPGEMKRVIILGPGASGKSTFAVYLGDITGPLVIELDKVFWQPGLVATPREQCKKIPQMLVMKGAWIMDGNLGPYDTVEVCLRAADTIIFLDFSILRCAANIPAITRAHRFLALAVAVSTSEPSVSHESDRKSRTVSGKSGECSSDGHARCQGLDYFTPWRSSKGFQVAYCSGNSPLAVIISSPGFHLRRWATAATPVLARW